MTFVQFRGVVSQCPRLGLVALLFLFFPGPVFSTLDQQDVAALSQDGIVHGMQTIRRDSGSQERKDGSVQESPSLGPSNGLSRRLCMGENVVHCGLSREVAHGAQAMVYEGRGEPDQTWWYLIAMIAVGTLLLVSLLLAHYIWLNRRLRHEARLHQEVETVLRKQQDELVRLANTDPLTGVWNRLKFEGEAKHEVARAERYDLSLSLIFLDLDHFKEVNDRYGHAMGDAILREMCERVKDSLRDSDHLCRWGGEEFLILVPHADLDRATLLAEKLRHAVADVPAAHGQPMSVSLGVVSRESGDTLEDLVRKADVALYRAKSRGRNRVEVYHPGDQSGLP